MKLKLLTYKKAFYSLWAGQSLSLLGSGLTRFALMVWAYQNNGSVTDMVLLGFFSALAFMVCSPFAGVVVDRVNRKWIMFLADFGSGIVTLFLLFLTLSGKLSFWQLYVAEGLSGAFEAFQSPAFFSSVSLLMPKSEYTRSNALIGLARSVMQVMAPALSSVILTFGGLDLVMKIDLLTLLPGLLAVLLIDLPIPERSTDGQQAKGNFWHEFRYGFGYIFSRPGLRIITIVFMGVNLFAGLTYMSIISPMILTHTGGDKIALGTVQTVMGVGGILGGLILTFWHSPKKKVALFAWTTALSFLICDTLMALSRNVWSWSLSGFLAEVTIPFMVSPFYSIWQERVPTDVQGRVFSVREMLLSLPSPIGFLVGGLLADNVFEPFFSHPNLLSGILGWGPGVGMSAMFLASAVLGSLIGWLGVFHPEAKKLDLA